ncbi:hypothetical protein V8C86DRAFT_2561880 [Haematococcus lacustris]
MAYTPKPTLSLLGPRASPPLSLAELGRVQSNSLCPDSTTSPIHTPQGPDPGGTRPHSTLPRLNPCHNSGFSTSPSTEQGTSPGPAAAVDPHPTRGGGGQGSHPSPATLTSPSGPHCPHPPGTGSSLSLIEPDRQSWMPGASGGHQLLGPDRLQQTHASSPGRYSPVAASHAAAGAAPSLPSAACSALPSGATPAPHAVAVAVAAQQQGLSHPPSPPTIPIAIASHVLPPPPWFHARQSAPP